MKIQEVIDRHQLWLKDKTKGIQADFSDMDLMDANFSGANLMDANLMDANLRFADFGDASLMDANFSGADLMGADLRGVDLGSTNLNFAKWDGLHFPRTQNNRITNYYKGIVFCGCFKGRLAEFKKAVSEKENGCHRKKAYLNIIKQIENENT